jgi:hypothetical protein
MRVDLYFSTAFNDRTGASHPPGYIYGLTTWPGIIGWYPLADFDAAYDILRRERVGFGTAAGVGLSV